MNASVERGPVRSVAVMVCHHPVGGFWISLVKTTTRTKGKIVKRDIHMKCVPIAVSTQKFDT